MITQGSLMFSELEPCKHCLGEAIEQWRLAKDWKGEEYVAVVMMCSRCTFETCRQTGRASRHTAVENWNAGVEQIMSEPGSFGNPSRILTFEENWNFNVEYMGRSMPTLRG